jgi:hypothetical protein
MDVANAAPAQGRSIKPPGTKIGGRARSFRANRSRSRTVQIARAAMCTLLALIGATKVCGAHLWVRGVQAETQM